MRTAASTPRASATRSSVAKCTDVLAPDSISLMVAGRTPAVSASLAWDHPRASRSSRTRNRIGVMGSIYALAYAATRVPVRHGVGSPLRYRTLRRMVLQPLTERITMSARTAATQQAVSDRQEDVISSIHANAHFEDPIPLTRVEWSTSRGNTFDSLDGDPSCDPESERSVLSLIHISEPTRQAEI